MAFLKYLLPALAATQMVFADSKCSDTTIENQSDADGISSCKTLEGKVTIKSTYSQGLTLNGIKKITGDLISDGSGLTSLSADSLTSIGGNFTLTNVTALTDLSMPELTSIGKIRFDSLPLLTSLSFNKGVKETDDVTITNTGLTSLDGISLKKVGQLNIQANRDLKTINMNDLKNASGIINLSLNKDSLSVEFPNLGTAKGMTFRNISSVSIPSLEKLDGELGFWGTQFKTFYAPNLTSCGDMVFNENSKLTNISAPYLASVDGGITAARNDKLDVIDFPKLKKVTGAIDLSGTFSQLNLKALENVQGRFNVQSTSGEFSCKPYDKMSNDNVIKGKEVCESKKDNPSTADGKSGTADGSNSKASGGSNSDSTTGAAAINGVATPVVGVAAFFYALAQLV